MKNLILAGVVVFCAAGLLLGIQTLLLGLDVKSSVALASLPVGGFSKVHQVLEQGRLKASFRGLPKGVVSLQGFALPWYQMLIYGALIFVPLKELGGYIGGQVARIGGVSEPGAFIWIVAVIANLILFSGMYLVGTWIGARANKYGWLLGIAVPLVGQIIAGAADFILISDEQFPVIFGQPKTIGFFAMAVIEGALLAAIFCLLGVWRGRRARLSAYLAYLLGNLPADTRDTIVNLAYEEVKSLSTHPHSAQAAPQPQTA
jgi:hypothetical protein